MFSVSFPCMAFVKPSHPNFLSSRSFLAGTLPLYVTTFINIARTSSPQFHSLCSITCTWHCYQNSNAFVKKSDKVHNATTLLDVMLHHQQ